MKRSILTDRELQIYGTAKRLIITIKGATFHLLPDNQDILKWNIPPNGGNQEKLVIPEGDIYWLTRGVVKHDGVSIITNQYGVTTE